MDGVKGGLAVDTGETDTSKSAAPQSSVFLLPPRLMDRAAGVQ